MSTNIMQIRRYSADRTVRLTFICKTDGSRSLKANAGKVEIEVTRDRVIGLGSSYRPEVVIARRDFSKGKYTWGELNHYASLCTRNLDQGVDLPGQLPVPEPIPANGNSPRT